MDRFCDFGPPKWQISTVNWSKRGPKTAHYRFWTSFWSIYRGNQPFGRCKIAKTVHFQSVLNERFEGWISPEKGPQNMRKRSHSVCPKRAIWRRDLSRKGSQNLREEPGIQLIINERCVGTLGAAIRWGFIMKIILRLAIDLMVFSTPHLGGSLGSFHISENETSNTYFFICLWK